MTPAEPLPRPIIVVGANRSGTKWLSNMLCNHPLIVGVQAPKHTGVLETNFFGNVQRMFGDLRTPEKYVALIEMWAASDFFKAAGGNKETFYTHRPRPTRFLEVFELLMQQLALRSGARYWLQKTSPLHAREILSELRTPVPIVIRRDSTANIASTVQLARNQSSKSSVLRATLNHVFHSKLLDQLTRGCDALNVSYEELSKNAEQSVQRICAALNLEYVPSMLDTQWRRNTSFDGSQTRQAALSPIELRVVKNLLTVLDRVPLSLLRQLHTTLRSDSPYLVGGTFGNVQDEYSLKE